MSWVKIATAVLALMAICAAYLQGRSDGRSLERAAQQTEIDKWRINAEAAAELYADARDRKQIEYRTITPKVEAAKNATPDIADCRTGDDWMQLYRQNASIANSGVAASVVPSRP